MRIKKELYQLILRELCDYRGLIRKEVKARGKAEKWNTDYWIYSTQKRKPLPEATFRKLLPLAEARLAHAAATAIWLDMLHILDREDGDLTPAERDEVVLFLLEDLQARHLFAVDLVRRARELPPLDEYPEPEDVEPIRWYAGFQVLILKAYPQNERLAIVRSCRKFQHWGLAEALAHASDRAASRDLDNASAWASLAVEAAERAQGPADWLQAVRGYAAACEPHVRCILGDHDRADSGLAEARQWFEAGSDPDHILDRGRLLSFEASLRRGQRRFPEALDRIQEAYPVSHDPARILINKGAIFAVMGDHEPAISALRDAEALLSPQSEPRLWNTVDFNLAVAYIHVGRHSEAAPLIERAKARAVALGDELDLIRLNWVAGRAALGLGRVREARGLLEQAVDEFRREKLWYDVALAVLELDGLLLREGKTAEVKAHTAILAEIFKSKKVHREALVALRLFRDAAEQEAADEELARRILRFLFRARYDRSLRFAS
jgi:tetratricopeptide (TPR) repeat protein